MDNKILLKISDNCLNCETPLSPNEVFCKTCGQKVATERIDMHFLSHNIIHTLTHADSGIFHLIKMMSINPGKVISEYVTGKRKEYFNPFNFFFITVTISALLTNSFDLMQGDLSNPNAVSEFISKKFNIVIMVSVPIISLFTFLLFRKAKYNFAENLVFHCFTSGYRIIFFLLLFAFIIPFFRDYYSLILYTYLGCFTLYLIWAAHGFYGEKLWITTIKISLSFILTQLAISILVYTGVYIYYRFLQ